LASDNTKAGAAVAAFRYGGVEPKDIQTSGLSLQPQYAYPKGVPTVTGYQVTNSVTAILRNVAKSGAVIDGVVGVAGNAVQIQSVGFSADHPAALEDKARARAATQAVAHAKALARAAGRSLGRVCSLTDQSPPEAAGVTNRAPGYASAASDAARCPSNLARSPRRTRSGWSMRWSRSSRTARDIVEGGARAAPVTSTA
jgi:hypothetical protein